MDKEILDNLILIAQLHEHRTAKMLDLSAEFVNATNKITVKFINHNEVQIAYNFYNQTVMEIVPSELTYDFLDDLLQRKDPEKVILKYGTLINIHDWPVQLRPSILQIQDEKNYDQYLRHLKLTSERFYVEYFDGIIILKDKEKKLLTNVLRLRNALQQCI